MRQVNLVRKQEFAYLRGVQKRQSGDVSEPTLAGLPTKVPRAGKVRGDTLKKIDEIEAQLDLLWVSSRSKRAETQFGAEAVANTQFPSTQAASLGVLTQMMHHSEMPASVLLVQSLDDQATRSPAAVDESGAVPRTAMTLAPRFNATDSPICDEVLTEAAQFFARGEYELATQHLVRSLRAKGVRSGHALHRLLALLDIYRSTGNQAQFDWSVLEYFDFWDGRTPQWLRTATAENVPVAAPNTARAMTRSTKAVHSTETQFWRCPSVLSRVAADELRTHWSRGGSCTIDWTSLSVIEADASPMLTSIFDSESGAPEQLIFIDTPNLLYVLEQTTPIGLSETDRNFWSLRFCLLALMGMRAAFDAACTDFCLTYIEPGPVWRTRTVQFIGDAMSTAPAVPAPAANSPWHLHGHVLGDTGLGLAEPRPGRISVDCSTLVRMDATATSRLMHWLRQAAACGSEVHFTDVGLLVGAAWMADGVNALAQVHLRDST